MKRILFMMMCVMACAACGREEESNYDRVIWDYTPLTINLAIHSFSGNEYNNNPEYIKSVEIEYNGKIYSYEETTGIEKNAIFVGPPEFLYDSLVPTYFSFGRFTMDTDGEFTVRYKGYEWLVSFDTNIVAPGETEKFIYIDGEEKVPVSIWQGTGYAYVVQAYVLMIPNE